MTTLSTCCNAPTKTMRLDERYCTKCGNPPCPNCETLKAENFALDRDLRLFEEAAAQACQNETYTKEEQCQLATLRIELETLRGAVREFIRTYSDDDGTAVEFNNAIDKLEALVAEPK